MDELVRAGRERRIGRRGGEPPLVVGAVPVGARVGDVDLPVVRADRVAAPAVEAGDLHRVVAVESHAVDPRRDERQLGLRVDDDAGRARGRHAGLRRVRRAARADTRRRCARSRRRRRSCRCSSGLQATAVPPVPVEPPDDGLPPDPFEPAFPPAPPEAPAVPPPPAFPPAPPVLPPLPPLPALPPVLVPPAPPLVLPPVPTVPPLDPPVPLPPLPLLPPLEPPWPGAPPLPLVTPPVPPVPEAPPPPLEVPQLVNAQSAATVRTSSLFMKSPSKGGSASDGRR